MKDAGIEIKQLNELEFVKGEIYAHVWHSEGTTILVDVPIAQNGNLSQESEVEPATTRTV